MAQVQRHKKVLSCNATPNDLLFVMQIWRKILTGWKSIDPLCIDGRQWHPLCAVWSFFRAITRHQPHAQQCIPAAPSMTHSSHSTALSRITKRLNSDKSIGEPHSPETPRARPLTTRRLRVPLSVSLAGSRRPAAACARSSPTTELCAEPVTVLQRKPGSC
jgi:hypothetical protein